ncbi:SAM-dependent methyltransferase [Gangjinia marincola]|uniref:SAM-dependent methyltransferase n=1 Tax=Gangjinia marincola TaxID=578463 RepID=A0ABN1MEZ3_9FLAO
MNAPQLGKLYLIPTHLGNEETAADVLSPAVIHTLQRLNHFIVENEKTARRFIKHVVPGKVQAELHLQTLNKHTDALEYGAMLEPCLNGHDVGIISEAGCPGIADPGAVVVAKAHAKNIKVMPLVGPSSILLTMMASGLNGQNFAFNGYLPLDKTEQKKKLKQLERRMLEENQAQLFMETPYRNNKLLDQLIQTLLPQTMLCIGCDLTLTDQYISTKSVKEWKNTKVDLHKRPTIFVIGEVV